MSNQNVEYEEGLTLLNICGGAVPERFAHELRKLLENIADQNNPIDPVRKLTIEIEFTPFPDRTGAQISVGFKSKLSSIDSVGGTVHFARQGGLMKAYPHDPRQARMFASPADKEKPI